MKTDVARDKPLNSEIEKLRIAVKKVRNRGSEKKAFKDAKTDKKSKKKTKTKRRTNE